MRMALISGFAIVSVCGVTGFLNTVVNAVEERATVPAAVSNELDDAREQKFTLANGEFTIRVKWGHDPLGQRDQLEARIAFLPNRKQCPACRKIGLIQIAKVLDNHGRDIVWTLGEANRNILRTDTGWFVDHRAASCSKNKRASLFYSEYWPSGAKTGSNRPNRSPVSAVIEDAPIGWDEMSAIYLETCAVDEDSGVVLGSIRWGGEWSIAPNSQPQEVKCESSNVPTANFTLACARFSAFYTPRFDALANLKSAHVLRNQIASFSSRQSEMPIAHNFFAMVTRFKSRN